MSPSQDAALPPEEARALIEALRDAPSIGHARVDSGVVRLEGSGHRDTRAVSATFRLEDTRQLQWASGFYVPIDNMSPAAADALKKAFGDRAIPADRAIHADGEMVAVKDIYGRGTRESHGYLIANDLQADPRPYTPPSPFPRRAGLAGAVGIAAFCAAGMAASFMDATPVAGTAAATTLSVLSTLGLTGGGAGLVSLCVAAVTANPTQMTDLPSEVKLAEPDKGRLLSELSAFLGHAPIAAPRLGSLDMGSKLSARRESGAAQPSPAKPRGPSA